MSTNFTGVKIRKPTTSIVDIGDFYMSLIDSIETKKTSGTGGAVGGGLSPSALLFDPKYEVIPSADVAGKFVNPYVGTAKLKSVVGLRSLDGGSPREHKGVDFALEVGRDVVSVYTGVIEVVKYQADGAGLYVVVNHGPIGDKVYKTVYMHLSDLSPIIFGRTRQNFNQDDINKILDGYNPKIKVDTGDVIGKSGGKKGIAYLDETNKKYDTAGKTSGPHLHWELRIGEANQQDESFNTLPYVNGLNFIPDGKNFKISNLTEEAAMKTTLDTKKGLKTYQLENQIKVKNFFKNKGLTKTQVAGIMGNIQKESTFNPQAFNKKDSNGYSSYGLIQWNQRYTSKIEVGDTVEAQLDYLVNKYKDYTKWLNLDDSYGTKQYASAAAFEFARVVERCQFCLRYDEYSKNDPINRSKFANDFMNRFVNNSDQLYW